jgi:hypothetical protein
MHRLVAYSAGGSERAAGIALTWQVLVACASPNSSAERLNDALCAKLDWPVLFAQADEHSVLPLLAARLQELAPAASPPEIQTKLQSWQRAHAVFTLTLSAELFQILERFAALDIEVLITKGPALSVRCYGDPGTRQYGDLDLIVRDKDIERATKTMIELGFELKISLHTIRGNKIPGEYVFTRRDKKLLIEFHTERTFRYHPRTLDIERLFKRRASVTIDGREVPALSLEDELVLICVHGAKHFWERLMWIADVAALISSKQAPDFDRTIAIAHEVGAGRILRLGLRLASDVLGAKLPASLEASVRSDRAVAKLAAQIQTHLPSREPRGMGVLQRAAFRVRMRGSLLSGAAYLLRLSLSPTEEDWTPGKEGNRPAFIDAISRPFRLAKKYSRRSVD